MRRQIQVTKGSETQTYTEKEWEKVSLSNISTENIKSLCVSWRSSEWECMCDTDCMCVYMCVWVLNYIINSQVHVHVYILVLF